MRETIETHLLLPIVRPVKMYTWLKNRGTLFVKKHKIGIGTM